MFYPENPVKDGVITGVVSSLFHPDREKPIVSFFLHARDKFESSLSKDQVDD